MQRVELGEDFLLIIPSASPLALQARLSLRAVLGHVSERIEAYRSTTTSFDEWVVAALDLQALDQREQSGAMYASYCSFQQAVSHEPPMTLTAFGRRLSALGLAKVKGGNGRIARLHCKLKTLTFARVTDSYRQTDSCLFDWQLTDAENARSVRVEDCSGREAGR